MATARWKDFIEWARYARAKPAFDREERQYRLALANAVRELIAAARDGRPLQGAARAVARANLESIDPAVAPGQAARLVCWAEENEPGLASALLPFSEAANDPVARLESFVASIESGPGAGRFAGGGLVVASLLNFGVAPEQLPTVRMGRYGRTQELLGGPPLSGREPVEEYRRHLAFMRNVEAALIEAGVPVRDMLDVESLTSICSMQEELWSAEPEHARGRTGSTRAPEPDVYLAATMTFRNEAGHLAEWIEFHLLVGVERFFLYDNGSDDGSREVLEPYLDEGIAVVYDWPGTARSPEELNRIQVAAYDHCMTTHGAEARWIAMMDSDLFLFSPTGQLVPEVLADYTRWPAVVVNLAQFGTSGHVTRPAGLVLENYTIRLDMDERAVKSIVDPAAVARCLSAHQCEYEWGSAVDEHGYPFSSSWNMTKSPSFERLRLNHYFGRSETDLREKRVRRFAEHDSAPLPDSTELQRAHRAGVIDDAILSYLPDLRAALERRASRGVR